MFIEAIAQTSVKKRLSASASILAIIINVTFQLISRSKNNNADQTNAETKSE